jgi:hypothetical protein
VHLELSSDLYGVMMLHHPTTPSGFNTPKGFFAAECLSSRRWRGYRTWQASAIVHAARYPHGKRARLYVQLGTLIHGPCVSTSFLLTDAWPYVLFALELHASTCMLMKDGRTAGSTSVALMHQLVNDVVVVVHIYATSLRSTTEDQVTI